MRLVLDTNILVSALLMPHTVPARLVKAWRMDGFTLLTSAVQIDELARVTRYPKIRNRLTPALAGRLINELRDMSVNVTDLPPADASQDPYDNYLLSIAEGGRADYLVTGDKRDLLSLGSYRGTRIITALTALQTLEE